ncbi:hypothetical protein MINTM005_13920 [Mycobacterium intracellulare]|uniref:hypothetical protein n=1 Tax=Mycobacterium intracellulare TaxID=1767 RepID=UPI001927B4CE|nr:hypothetical protein [Mycobacterium intracellulare]BCO56148.1 hypothetical protein MINTM005_13920 [Mycobacterium intracellulare]
MKGYVMQRITVGRYPDKEAGHYGGWIEGVRDDGSTWIMFVNSSGSPVLFWNQREEDGAVIGEPILLGG